MFKNNLFTFLLIFSFFFLFSQNPGTLDPGFGNNGFITCDYFTNSNGANDIVVDQEGRMTIGGNAYLNSQTDFFFARFLPDGSLDVSFNDDGLLSLAYGGSQDYINRLALQADQKVVAVGFTSTTGSSDIAVARINTDGTLDNTFSLDGLQVIDIRSFDYGYNIQILDNGKILILGYSQDISSGQDPDLVLVRLMADGSLDASFGNNGIVLLDLSWGSYDYMDGLVVDDDYIYTSGISYEMDKSTSFISVVKFESDGQLVNDFGNTGVASMELEVHDQFWGTGTDLALDGNILYVATHSGDINGPEMAIISFLNNGIPNTDFGNAGLVITEMIGSSSTNAIMIQPDHSILVGGYHEDNVYELDFCLARYFTNGDLDPDFGDYYGVQWVNLSEEGTNLDDVILSMKFTDNHKIVAAGYCHTVSGGQDVALAQLYSGIQVNIDPITRADQFMMVENPLWGDDLHLKVSLSEKSTVKFYITHINGKLLFNLKNFNLEQGSTDLNINLPNIPDPGTYLLVAEINGTKISNPLIVL